MKNLNLPLSKDMPYLDAEGRIHVCAWCHPGFKIFNARPEWAGRPITHGICPQHSAEMLAAVLRKEAA